MAKRKKSTSKPDSPKKTPNKVARDQDVLWRSVRLKSEPLTLGLEAYNFHSFQVMREGEAQSEDLNLKSNNSSRKFSVPIKAKNRDDEGTSPSTTDSYRFASWQIGERVKSLQKQNQQQNKTRPELEPGVLSDMDRATAEKFRRGRLGIDARVDLHGLNQEQAQAQLARFIAMSHNQGHRCLIVVTGKGDPRKGGGVLKRNVPMWLNLPENRSKILAVTNAQPKDGGGGALYILLRRRK